MRIQRIVISQGEPSSLYFRGGTESEGRITLKSGERLSFDTYFNSFTYTKYQQYTTIDAITFRGTVKGHARVSLCTYDGKEEITVASTQAQDSFALNASFSTLSKEAYLYPVIEAMDETIFLEGEYWSDAEGTSPSCAIAICTYRREEYLKNNLKILKESRIPYIDHIIVVDNGGTVEKDMLDGDRVSLFPNPNYGGSAGFTRGIIEAKRAGHTHVILMDDDIVIYPEALERMTVFLSLLAPAYKNAHISAAMLPTSCLYLQHEKGARWDGSHIESIHTKLDVRSCDALIENLSDGPIGYGAWWCFCLPLSDVEEFGLPLPLFIKFDDVEYGIRCCKNAPIVTMSGIAVAHADFDGKYNMHLEYYTIRNQLIMLASHRMQGTFGCILRLMKVTAKHIFLYRYSAMPILLRAFEDFLKGADFLMTQDAEKLNRSVMSMTPPAVELSTLPDWNPGLRNEYTPSRQNRLLLGIKSLTLGGHIIPAIFMKKKTAVAPLPSAKPGDCFFYRRTIQYQQASDSGYVFEKSTWKFFGCLASAVKMAFKILFGYRRAAKTYRESFTKMTSHEFWTHYLGL